MFSHITRKIIATLFLNLFSLFTNYRGHFKTCPHTLQILATVLNLSPYYGPGIGEYQWTRAVGGCSPRWAGQKDYILLVLLISLVPLSIVIVTTIWTCMNTRSFLKKTLRRQTCGMQSSRSVSVQQNLYSKKVKNLFGIFGALILSYLISWTPFLISSVAAIVVGIKDFPHEVFATTFVIFMLQNATAPLIQIYFRRDLLDSLKAAVLRSLNCRRPRRIEILSDKLDDGKEGRKVECGNKVDTT